MLAKKYRVPRQYIDYILEKGESYRSKLFIVRFKKNHAQFFRFRAIISRKIEDKAVKRNRLRRQTYEAIRTNLKEKKTLMEGLDLVLIAKKNARNATFADLNKDIKENIFNKNYGKI